MKSHPRAIRRKNNRGEEGDETDEREKWRIRGEKEDKEI